MLRIVYVIFRDQDKLLFYVNNYINWDEFNQLYNLDWIKKNIKNADTVACKFRPALTRVTNYRLKVAREEGQKREEMMERGKTEAMAAKCWKARGEIGFSSEKKRNYKSDTRDKIDSNQANDEYPLPNWEIIKGKLQVANKIV